MKKSIILLSIIISVLTGCKTQQQSSTLAYDDVYANPKYSNKPAPVKQKNMDLSVPQQITTPDSSSASKSGSWYDDYNDYSNSVNQQGSNSQKGYSGNGNNIYSDPNLSDNSYSSSPNVNIYLGTSYDPFFWGSSLSFGWGFGCGWGSSYWGYPYSSWYYPYYGYYPYAYGGWGDYWNGYNNGYWNGYNDGFWDGSHGNPYYNTYSSFYYGQRRMLSSGGDGNIHVNPRKIEPGSQTTTDINASRMGNPRAKVTESVNNTESITQKRTGQAIPNQERINPSGRIRTDAGSTAEINKTPADRQHYKYDRSKINQAPVNPRNESVVPNSRQNNQRGVPSAKDARQGERSRSTGTAETQSYSSPAYRQPKYSQEYINPRSQDNRNTGARESNNNQVRSSSNDNRSQNRGYVAPSSNARRFTTPSNNNNSNNQRSYSTPSRSNSSSGYSSPSRSYSTPSTSGSRSGGGGSYSAPSRSSGGSSAPSGSGGGGGGGRRR